MGLFSKKDLLVGGIVATVWAANKISKESARERPTVEEAIRLRKQDDLQASTKAGSLIVYIVLGIPTIIVLSLLGVMGAPAFCAIVPICVVLGIIFGCYMLRRDRRQQMKESAEKSAEEDKRQEEVNKRIQAVFWNIGMSPKRMREYLKAHIAVHYWLAKLNNKGIVLTSTILREFIDAENGSQEESAQKWELLVKRYNP